MKLFKFTGNILKDFFLNIYYLVLGLLLVGLLLCVGALMLAIGLVIMSIIPNILSKLGYNNLASILMIVEIIIAFLFVIDINIFKLPKNIIKYLKIKWDEIENI